MLSKEQSFSYVNLLLLRESSYLSISKLFSSPDKRNRFSLRLKAWRESLSLDVNLFEITVLFQRLGPRYEMLYGVKFVWHKGFWIVFEFRSAYLVFLLWVKILQNTGGFKFCLHLYIKRRISKIFNLKTFKAFKSFNRELTCVCDNDKYVQVYFYRCLPWQYLHSLHNYEWTKNIVALEIVCLIHLLIYRKCLWF